MPENRLSSLAKSRTELLSVGELIEAAVNATGLSDFGDQAYLPSLVRLWDALTEQAQLNQAGRQQVNRMLTGRLANRLRLHEQQQRIPAAVAVPISRPVFLIGLHRTGSTYVHSLLGQHPALCWPAAWELMHPITPANRGEGQLVEATADAFDDVFDRNPDFRVIHDMAANQPDECRWLLQNEFEDLTEATIEYRIPRYSRWLAGADLTRSYAGHRQQLQHILWRRPRSGRLILKNPGHLWHLPELIASYPDAQLIVLHRDPLAAIGSACSLSLSSRRMTSDLVDLNAIGRERVELTASGLAALMAFRDSGKLAPEQLLDLRYDELLADPAEVARRTFAFLDLPMPAPVQLAVQGYVRTHPQYRYGRHSYQLDQFGIRSRSITDQFTDYRARYL
ncbi:MAG: sulfotransferase [Jatrophihabitantaceae bacterium]